MNDMIASPGTYAKHVKNTESEKKMADTLVPLMADAMTNTYTPGQPQSGRNGGALEIVLDYKPNPKFVPPTTEAQALTGLQGRVWIDAKTRYVVRMEGTIFRSSELRLGDAGPHLSGGHGGDEPDQRRRESLDLHRLFHARDGTRIDVEEARHPLQCKGKRLPDACSNELSGRDSPAAGDAATRPIEDCFRR